MSFTGRLKLSHHSNKLRTRWYVHRYLQFSSPDTSLDVRYTLYTDASRFVVGAMLLQDQGIGLQHVAYHDRKMNKHNVHYDVHEQDLLLVRDALLKFRCYLDGAAGLTVITDHDTLRHFFSASRFVYSTGAMAISLNALSTTDGHREQAGSSQPCGCSVTPN
jgi:hypothetical protein